jgi:hypothetical protein
MLQLKTLTKHTFTLLLLSFLSITSVAQDYKANIKQRFNEYCGYLSAGEFDKSLDYVPEAIFTVVPRAQMVALFEQMLKGKEMQIKFISFDIKDVADIRKIDTCYYVRVKYLGVMSMKMNSGKTESADEKANRMAMTKQAFANAFGSDNVKLDESTETYTITAAKSSWAISKNGQTGWKFVNVEPKQRLIMEKILPKELIDESIN